MSQGSSGPSQQTVTNQVQLPDWLNWQEENAVGQAAGIAQGRNPYQNVPSLTTTVPDMNGQQLAANNAIYNLGMSGGTSSVQSGNNYLTSLINGGQQVQAAANPYTNYYNPATQSEINQANQNITNTYMNATAPQLAAQFSQAGAFGGSAMNQQQQLQQNTLAQNLGYTDQNILGQNYQTAANLAQQQADQANQVAMANQQQRLQGIYGANVNQQNIGTALNQAYGAGTNQYNISQQQAQQAYNQAYNNQNWQEQQLQNLYLPAVTGASGIYRGSTTTSPNLNQGATGAGVLGGAASGAAIGTMIEPGWGTAIGAGAGALAGLL